MPLSSLPIGSVHLRPISDFDRAPCLALRVADDQADLVATNEKSLRQADENPALRVFAVYDAAARGWEQPKVPMVGFAMIELSAGVGFVNRLMIDAASQGRGYGTAALAELVRRFRLTPDVEMIAASHRRRNEVMAGILRRQGFVPWDIEHAAADPDEVYVRLPNSPF